MTSLQIIDKETPPRLDNIPEDAALEIAGFIQAWAENRRSNEERERGRKVRDATLRAVSLTCRTSFTVFHQSLLTNVTLTLVHLLPFYEMMQRNKEHGRSIKSITWAAYPDKDEAMNRSCLQVASFSPLPPQPDYMVNVRDGIKLITHRICRDMVNLQTLIVYDTIFAIPFQEKIDGKLVPASSLTKHLKKIYVVLSRMPYLSLSASNVIWILTFSPSIESAALGFNIDKHDAAFLEDFHPAFQSKSNVRQLALNFKFTSEDNNSKSWWHSSGESIQSRKIGQRKSEAIRQLLLVTKDLTSLELFSDEKSRDPWDVSIVNTSCISGLFNSSKSLLHLRLLRMGPEGNNYLTTPYHLLKAIKILSFDYLLLYYLSQIAEIPIPPTLEVLILPYYQYGDQFLEEVFLTNLLKRQDAFPSLKEVIVPLKMVDSDGRIGPSEVVAPGGRVLSSAQLTKIWIEKRKALQSAKIFRDGKVKLRTAKPGEIIGDPTRGESFMSTLKTVSP